MKKLICVLLSVLVLISLSASAFAATGLGSVTTVKCTAATAEKNGSVSVNTTLCAVTLDDEGKIVSVSFDVVQPKGAFDTAGALQSDEAMAPQTKREMGDSYGMKAATTVGKEWYEQMDAFEAWCVGKTVEEVVGMPTYDKGDGKHTTVADVPDLKSSCTVNLGDQFEALRKAAAAAK